MNRSPSTATRAIYTFLVHFLGRKSLALFLTRSDEACFLVGRDEFFVYIECGGGGGVCRDGAGATRLDSRPPARSLVRSLHRRFLHTRVHTTAVCSLIRPGLARQTISNNLQLQTYQGLSCRLTRLVIFVSLPTDYCLILEQMVADGSNVLQSWQMLNQGFTWSN